MSLNSLNSIQELPQGNLYHGVLKCASRTDLISESKEEIIETFLKYEGFVEIGEYLQERDLIDQEAIEVEKKIKRWLIISGQAILITAFDWSVNRSKEAEKNLGLASEGYENMQNILREKYAWESPVHLHKGPGNGFLYHSLAIQDPYWKQIALGDKIYFTAEDIFQDFTREDIKTNPYYIDFIKKIFSNIIKKGLREKWLNITSQHVEQWNLKEGVDFADLNDIFPLLESFSDPNVFKKELKTFFSSEDSSILTSQSFELDSSDIASLPIAIITLKLMFPYGKDLGKQILYSKKNIQDDIREKKDFLEGLRSSDVSKLGKRDAEKIKRILYDFNTSKSSIGTLEELKYYIEYYDSILRFTDIVFQNRDEIFLSESFPDLCAQWYTEDFIAEIVRERKTRKIDLNEHPYMYFGNFVQGDFSQMLDIIQDTPDIISSTRGDSHLTNEQYEQDIYRNLMFLPAGGIYISDGVRQSYSNYYRIDEIKRTLNKVGKDNFHIDYVLNSQGEILSVCIQKRHEKGYLNLEEKRGIFSSDVIFQSGKEIKQNPVFSIVQDVKLRALTLSGGNTGIFKGINIEQRLVQELTHQVLNSYISEREIFDTLKRAIIEELDMDTIVEMVKQNMHIDINESMREVLEMLKNGGIGEGSHHNKPPQYDFFENLIIKAYIEQMPKARREGYDDELWKKFIMSNGIISVAYEKEARLMGKRIMASQSPSTEKIKAVENIALGIIK